MQQVKTNIAEQIHYLHTNAVAKHKAGKIEEAISLYLAAIEVDENQPAWIYGNVIILLSQVGRLDEGLRLGKKAEKIHPESDEIVRAIGKVLYEAKRFSESINYYQQAIKLVSEQPAWLFADLVAQLVEIQRFEEAIDIGNQGIKFYQDSEWLYFHLGKLYESQGEFKLAIEKYEKALSYDKNIPVTREYIERIRFNLQELDNLKLKINEKDNNSSQQLFILRTNEDDPSGLGIVSRKSLALGNGVSSTKTLKGKVLVPGMPDLYQELLNKDNYNYLLTTFESSKIPDSWVESINNYYHEVFVPHSYVKKTFLDSGVNIPVSIISYCYPQRNRTRPIEKNKSKLKLGVLGAPNHRKNIDKLVEAVTQLNQENYEVELVIHCPWLLDSKQEVWKTNPNINLTVGIKSDEEIDEWYSNLDAYIYPSSGEGWSFTPRESMSLGIPTIVTDIPVHEELVESGFYLPLCSNRWESAYYEFLRSTCGEWKYYSVQNIKQSIVQLIQEYDHWFNLAQVGKNWVADKYQWQFFIKQLEQAINIDKSLVTIKPDNHIAEQMLGDSFVEQQKWDEAIAAYRRSIEFEPNYANSYYSLGNILAHQGLVEEASDCYYKAVKLGIFE